MPFEIQQAIRDLGYDARWLAWGLFDEPYLRAQYENFSRDREEGTEHYRAAALRHYFETTAEISDDQLDRYLDICGSQSDPILAPHYLHELIRFSGLRDEQLERLRKHALFQTAGLQAALLQMELCRNLNRNILTDEIFARCLQLGDGSVHTLLLSHPGMTPERYRELGKHGANRRIRNIAAQYARPRRD